MSVSAAAEIEKALNTHTEDRMVSVMLDICVGRILRKEAKQERDWTLQYKPDSIDHIVEWLTMACADNAHWLHNTSVDGKPKKLLKFSKIDDVVKEADRFFRKRTSSSAVNATRSDDEAEVMDFGDGYRMVRLSSVAALDREGLLMRHCVGSGSYDEALTSGSEVFFSLRDKRNKPHVTMEVRAKDKKVRQARGKQNAYPIPKYAKMVALFAKREGFDLTGERVGLSELRTPEGDVLDPDELPQDRVVLVGSNNIWSFLRLDAQGIDRWPRVVEVVGDAQMDFFADGCPEEVIVSGTLKIGQLEAGAPLVRIRAGSLNIENTQFRSLPEDTVITGNLAAKNSRIEKLPQPLRMSGTIDIQQTSVKTIPTGTTCHTLLLGQSEVRSIPEDISIKGDLLARESELRILPRGLSVPGKIDLSSSKVRVLPQNLSCGILDISLTKIARIPRSTLIWSSLIAKHSALADIGPMTDLDTLDISGCPMLRMPDNLRIGRLLDISNLRLPIDLERITVGESINADGTTVSAMPSSLSVTGALSFRDAKVARLPEHLACDTLMLDGTDVEALPPSLVVRSWLSAVGAGIKTVADLSQVGGIVDLNGTKLEELPAGLVVHGSLWIENTPIRRLPDHLNIGMDLNATGSCLSEIGKGVVIGRSANFLGTLIDEAEVTRSRIAAGNVFDKRGRWLDGYSSFDDHGSHIAALKSLVVGAFDRLRCRLRRQ
jgi:hypothetical protein